MKPPSISLVCLVLLGLSAAPAAGSRRPPQCWTSQLAVHHGKTGAGLGHEGFVLVLTNRSSSRCRTGGYVGLLRLDRRRHPVRTVLHRGNGYLFQGPRPHTIVLARGQSASTGVEWIDNPVPSDTHGCVFAGAYLEITPPNETTHRTIRLNTSDCGRGYLSTTALQAGRRGPR